MMSGNYQVFRDDPLNYTGQSDFSPINTITACEAALKKRPSKAERYLLFETFIQATVTLPHASLSDPIPDSKIENALTLAHEYLTELDAAFSGSSRVLVLRGMLMEVKGNTAQALELYNTFISTNECNLVVRKRRLALLVDLSLDDVSTQTAIEALVVHLDTFSTDRESWQVLAKLYTRIHHHSQALYCYEELTLLGGSGTIVWLERMAGCMLWLNNPEAALRLYCRVVELCGDCLGGWVGIRNCCKEETSGDKNTREALLNVSLVMIDKLS